MMSEVIQVQNDQEVQAAIDRTAQALAGGKVVIFPTETVYGVGACVTQAEAMERLRRLKDRQSGTKPFSVHIGDKTDANLYVNRMPPLAERLIRKAWPGPLAIVLPVEDPAATPIAQVIGAENLHEVFHKNTIGLRCPDDPVTTPALAAVRTPVVAASANRPGNAPPTLARDAIAELDGQVDLIIDGGTTRYTKPSTIVQILVDGSWKLLRSGVLDERAIRRLVSTTILFVCSGNTCRSPMAEGLCKHIIAAKLGVGVEKLGDAGFEILSAGVGAVAGMPASSNAIEACRQVGTEIAGHRSRPLSPELIRQADTIFTMCQHHSDSVVRLVPQAAGKVQRLDPQRDISDPAGSDVQEYVQCMQQIRASLEARFREMI